MVCLSFQARFGKICFSQRSSCFRSLPAPGTLVPLGRLVRRIPRSFKPRRVRISSSYGFMRCSHSCHPRWKLPLYLSGRWLELLHYCSCPSFSAKARKAGGADPPLFLRFCSLQLRLERLRASLETHRGARSWTRGAVFPFRPSFCTI